MSAGYALPRWLVTFDGREYVVYARDAKHAREQFGAVDVTAPPPVVKPYTEEEEPIHVVDKRRAPGA